MVEILHYIGTLELGGSQSFVMELYRNIDRERLRFDFVIFEDRRGELYDEVIHLGGKVYECPKYNGLNHFAYIRWWNGFLKAHPEYKVVHGHVRSEASIYLPIMRRHSVFTILHSHSTSNGHGLKALVKTVLQIPVGHMADYYMACSDEAGKWLFGEKVVQGSRYKTVKNAVDIERFTYSEAKREEVRKEYNLEDNFVIGHVGRFVDVKNHRFLIEIFSKLMEHGSEVKPILLLVGAGPLMDNIRDLVREKGLEDNVVFAGARADTDKIYCAMDAFVFPSKWEGLGIALVEAQISGLPCFVSDRVPECVDIGSGLVERLSLTDAGTWRVRLEDNASSDPIRTSHAREARDAGYDIIDNAKMMQRFYLEEIGHYS